MIKHCSVTLKYFFFIGLNVNNYYYYAHGTKIRPKLLYVEDLFADSNLNSAYFLALLDLFSCASKIATSLEKSANPAPANRKLAFSAEF
jgi:hypothetical protein